MYTKDYRLWFKLDNRTRISILTPVGETDNATIMNGIGQGSFAAALASSINIGATVHDITKEEGTAKIGDMPLNCLIFQDDIAKMNESMKKARNGAKDIGRLLKCLDRNGKGLRRMPKRGKEKTNPYGRTDDWKLGLRKVSGR